MRAIVTIYRKELLDILRDRRTLISMIVVPLLLIPVLVFGMGLLSARAIGRVQEAVPEVMILGEENAPETAKRLRGLETIKVVPSSSAFKEAIAQKKVRAAVKIPKGFDEALEGEGRAEVIVYSHQADLRSEFAAQTLRRFFRDFEDEVVARRLAAYGLSTSLIHPVEVHQENVAPPDQLGGSLVGGVLVYILMLLCLTGAMYPAMDLTAGEKERGTLETILASPVTRSALAYGKFGVVATAGMASALLGLLSSIGTFLAIKQLWEASDRSASPVPVEVTAISLDLTAVVAVLVMLVPLAAFFSSLLLAISLFAKSFKEAQSYVSPLLLVVILPAAVALLPGIELTPTLALVPVLNAGLVSKEILSGVYAWGFIATIFLSTCVYAAVALRAAVWLFEQETVLFRS